MQRQSTLTVYEYPKSHGLGIFVCDQARVDASEIPLCDQDMAEGDCLI